MCKKAFYIEYDKTLFTFKTRRLHSLPEQPKAKPFWADAGTPAVGTGPSRPDRHLASHLATGVALRRTLSSHRPRLLRIPEHGRCASVWKCGSGARRPVCKDGKESGRGFLGGWRDLFPSFLHRNGALSPVPCPREGRGVHRFPIEEKRVLRPYLLGAGVRWPLAAAGWGGFLCGVPGDRNLAFSPWPSADSRASLPRTRSRGDDAEHGTTTVPENKAPQGGGVATLSDRTGVLLSQGPVGTAVHGTEAPAEPRRMRPPSGGRQKYIKPLTLLFCIVTLEAVK